MNVPARAFGKHSLRATLLCLRLGPARARAGSPVMAPLCGVECVAFGSMASAAFVNLLFGLHTLNRADDGRGGRVTCGRECRCTPRGSLSVLHAFRASVCENGRESGLRRRPGQLTKHTLGIKLSGGMGQMGLVRLLYGSQTKRTACHWGCTYTCQMGLKNE